MRKEKDFMQISLSKRIAVSVLAVLMAIAFMPAMAFAEGGDEGDEGNTAFSTIGEKEYSSMQDAVNAAENGQTIALVSDSDADSYGTIKSKGDITIDGKSITINLNGQKLDLGSSRINVKNKGILTVKDSGEGEGSIVSSGSVAAAYDGGKFILKSGTIESTNSSALWAGTSDIGNGSVTIDGGYVHSQEFAIGALNEGSVITVNDGMLEAEDNAVLANNGKEGLGGTTINVNGGYLYGRIQTSGYISCGIYSANSGTVNVTGGTIESEAGCGILMRAGVLNLTGGKITANTDDTRSYGKVGDSKFNVESSPIVIDEASNYPGTKKYPMKVSISGNPKLVCYSENPDIKVLEKADNNSEIIISGGSFDKSDVKKYIKKDSLVAQDYVDEDDAGDEYNLYVGNEAVQEAAKDAYSSSKIEIVNGSVTIPATRATIYNNKDNKGTVKVNGQLVGPGKFSTASIEDRIADLEKQVKDAQDALAKGVSKEDLAKLQKQLADTQKELNDLKQTATAKNLADLQKQLSDAQTALKSAQDQISVNNAAYAVPGKVADLKTKAGKKKITLTWKKATNATGYKIYRATKKSGKYNYFKATNNLKYVNKNLKKGKKYYYKVRAYRTIKDGQLFGAYSEIAGAKVK